MEQRGLTIRADGLRLDALIYLPSHLPAPYPAVCICHGIPAGPPDPSDRGYQILAERFCAQGFVVLLFNFRGTGESEGNLDLLGWTRDLAAVVDYLHGLEEVDSSRLSVVGFSGGAAVSVYRTAHDPRITSLVTCACPAHFHKFVWEGGVEGSIARFREIGAIRDADFPASPQEWAQGFAEMTPINWISGVSPRPLLIVHGGGDDVVDPSHAQELFQQAGEPKELLIVPGGEHPLKGNKLAMDAALAWLRRVNGLR